MVACRGETYYTISTSIKLENLRGKSMNKLKQILFLVPVMALAVSVVAVPAYAHNGEAHEDGAHKTQTRSGAKVASVDTEKRQELEDKLRDSGPKLLSEARKGKQLKTLEQRKKSCEDRKSGLQTKLNRLTSNAKKHEARITAKLEKATEYQETANLSVANYDALVAAAEAAQVEAQTSIAALEELKPTVDCTTGTVAEKVATFKAAAAEVRTDLQAYKMAVKEVFVALMNAKGGSGNETEGTGTETETETETTEGQQ